MNDYDYRRQMALYMEIWPERVTRLTERELMAMAQDYIIIHRPDKLSPKKKVKEFRFE